MGEVEELDSAPASLQTEKGAFRSKQSGAGAEATRTGVP